MRLDRAIDLFLRSRRAAGRSDKTIDWYSDQLLAFTRWLEGPGRPWADGGEWPPAMIDAFLADARARGLSPATVNARFRALRAFMGWLAARGYLVINPMPQVSPPKIPKRMASYVTLPELDRLLAAITGDSWLDRRDGLAIRILFYCGLRAAELCGLATADLDLVRRIVVVRSGKGSKDRIVPMPPELGPAALAYLIARPPWAGPELFIKSDGYSGAAGALRPEGLRQLLIRRCRAANMDPINPHRFRHGFAMAFLNAGAELGAVASMMGHSSAAITENFYASWLAEGISREYDRALAEIRRADRANRPK